jgi:hypothetical protein
MKPIPTTAERWRRYQRDLAAHRRRSLFRRSHQRFQRDLAILPHRFLPRDRARMARLLVPAGQLREELKGHAIWTLDTAARLVTGHGFLVAHDLTGYLDAETLEKLIAEGSVGIPEQAGLSVDLLYVRPPVLLALCWLNAPLAGVRRWHGVGFPLATLLFLYILWRSTLTILWHGGIDWRGTHYPLADLKANRI